MQWPYNIVSEDMSYVELGFQFKVPQTGGLSNVYSLTLLRARSSALRSKWGCALPKVTKEGILPCLFLASASFKKP